MACLDLLPAVCFLPLSVVLRSIRLGGEAVEQ